MGEEGHVMLLLAGDLGCDLRVGRTFRTPQYRVWGFIMTDVIIHGFRGVRAN